MCNMIKYNVVKYRTKGRVKDFGLAFLKILFRLTGFVGEVEYVEVKAFSIIGPISSGRLIYLDYVLEKRS